jgi:peroxiredoxin
MMKNMTRLSRTVVLMTALCYPATSFGQFYFVDKNPLVGKKAPDFTLKTSGGKKVNMTEYRGGRNAVIFFWATWCPECKKHIKKINRQKEQIEQAGVKMIFVNVDEGERIVQSYLQKSGMDMEVFLDQWVVSREDFAEAVKDEEKLFLELVQNGYVDKQGYVQGKFEWVMKPEDMGLSVKNKEARKAIFDIISNAHLTERYHLVGLPTLFFIDKNGTVRDVVHHFPDNFKEIFDPKTPLAPVAGSKEN